MNELVIMNACGWQAQCSYIMKLCNCAWTFLNYIPRFELFRHSEEHTPSSLCEGVFSLGRVEKTTSLGHLTGEASLEGARHRKRSETR